MTYARLSQRMDIVQEITGNTAISTSDDRTEQQGFVFDRKHSDTPMEENVSRGTAASASLCGTDTAGGNVSAGNGIGAAVAELIIQPHIAPTSGGGSGSGNDRDWNDEDKEKKAMTVTGTMKTRRRNRTHIDGGNNDDKQKTNPFERRADRAAR